MERSNGIMRLLVAATVAGMLLLSIVIVAVIVTVRFRRNPRGNARHLRHIYLIAGSMPEAACYAQKKVMLRIF